MTPWTRAIWVLGAVTSALVISGCAVNPLTGEEEPMFMSVQEELALGRQMAPEVERALQGVIPNEALQRYVDRIGQRIARVCHRPDWEYRYRVVEDPMINAFAVPGGHVYVTRGILEKLTSEAQLASILAHETAHIVARDSAASMSKQQLMQAGLLAAAAAAAAGRADPRAIGAVQLTEHFFLLQYSREDEAEADFGGLDYMVGAGYSPHGMTETMQILMDEAKIRPIEFLSTHPSPENRLRYLRETIAYKHPDTQGLKVGKEEYQTTVLDFLKTHPKPRKRREP